MIRLTILILTALSGKLFAVVLTELVNPPLPPAPVMKEQITKSQKVNADIDPDGGAPLSYILRIAEYPTRRSMKAPTSV